MKITLNLSIYLYFAILIMILPAKWIIAWLIAVCFHEACHYIAIKLCGGHSEQLHAGFGGAVISCSGLTSKKQLFSLLAGPIGGLIPVFLGRFFPRVALCSWVLSVYNLLPILPLDGGQALQLILKNKKLFSVIENAVLITLMLFGIYISIWLQCGVLPIVIVALLWMKNRKSPCKEALCKLQ